MRIHHRVIETLVVPVNPRRPAARGDRPGDEVVLRPDSDLLRYLESPRPRR